MEAALAHWHRLVAEGNPAGLESLLADNVTFHSPVVHTPQQGKQITAKYLAAAFHVLFNETFEYVREIVGDRHAMLEFVVELDGVHVNGVDIVSWNEDDQIVDFKVMVRPLQAIKVVHEQMAAALQSAALKSQGSE